MPTPQEAEQLLRDEQSIEARKFRFAREMDEARETQTLRRTIRNQMAVIGNPGSNLLPTIQALSPHERKNYSISKLVADMVKETKESTLEREISWSLQKDIGTPEHGGHLIPFRMSGLDTRTNAQGKYLTETRVNDVIDYLVSQSKVLSLGARFLSGVKWSQQFPSEETAPQTSWVSENPGTDVAQVDPVFGVKTASPHSLQSSTAASRQLLQQASPSMEAWLKARIARGHAQAIDAAAINGSGVEGVPVGLLQTQGINDVPVGDNGGAATAAHILSLENAIAASNADSANCAFLTVPAQRQKLRALPQIANGTTPLWDRDSMLGYNAQVSNNVPSTLTKGSAVGTCSAIIFGDWSAMTIFEFSGAVEVVTDVYSLKKKNMVELASWAIYDVMITQPGGFAVIADAT